MFSLGILVLMFLMPAVQGTNMIQCPLCSSAATLPARLNYQVDSTQTCLDVYLAMGQLKSTDPQCINQQTSYRDVCCNANQPASLTPHPTSAPVYTGPVGAEPNCPICGTAEYPGIPSAYIVARYVGDYSCAELYDRGLNGLIPNFMCAPLQNYAEKVCGCGQYNPKCEADPTACWGYISAYSGKSQPLPSPTPKPSPAPPVAQPTPILTPQPSPTPPVAQSIPSPKPNPPPTPTASKTTNAPPSPYKQTISPFS